MKPTILLTGKTGQVGSQFARLSADLGEIVAPSRRELDLLDPDSIRRAVRSIRPHLIVNAAAYTAVDAAESDEAKAHAINAEAPAILAEEAGKVGAAIVHYSTDYVFDGSKRTPYEETDTPNPVNVYGKTKLAGEQAIQASGVPHLIFRTAWVYAARGRNFLLTILRLATETEELKIVRDQVGAPTCNWDIALASARLLTYLYQLGNNFSSISSVGGVYHLTAAGETTWYGFAEAILEQAARTPGEVSWFASATRGRPLIARRLIPITTSEYPTPAHRPAYSVLSNSRFFRTFDFQLPDWRSQMRRAFSGEFKINQAPNGGDELNRGGSVQNSAH